MADKGPLLVTDALTKLFDQARAVDNVSLAIPAGQFVGVIGRSGAGKSTLLRLINRLTDPSAGRVSCDGIEVTALRGSGLRDWRRRCAMIFQQFNLVGRLDVLNNVLMGRLAYAPAWQSLPKLWSREDKIMAMAALDQFGLAELAARREILRFAASAYKAGSPGAVQVTGYADPAGSAGYNQRLSLRRANAVAAELARYGVPRSAMTLSGAGETSSGPTPGQDRRVEIVFGGPPPSS